MRQKENNISHSMSEGFMKGPYNHPPAVQWKLYMGNFFFFFWLHHAACRNFPNQGSNPHPLQWKHRVLTTAPPGKSLYMGKLRFKCTLPALAPPDSITLILKLEGFWAWRLVKQMKSPRVFSSSWNYWFRQRLPRVLRPLGSFFFLAVLHGLQDFSSPTRDRTWAPWSGSTES